MAYVISSQNIILTTAMAVSGAVIFLSLCRIRNLPTILHHLNSQPTYPLRSCLCSDGKRKNSKKRVKFADNVKNNESKIHKEKKNKKHGTSTNKKEIPEIHKMPANRAALYQGILRDRVRIHRVECSY